MRRIKNTQQVKIKIVSIEYSRKFKKNYFNKRKLILSMVHVCEENSFILFLDDDRYKIEKRLGQFNRSQFFFSIGSAEF